MMDRYSFPSRGAAAGAWVEEVVHRAAGAEHTARTFRGCERAVREAEWGSAIARDPPGCAVLARGQRPLLAEIDENVFQPLRGKQFRDPVGHVALAEAVECQALVRSAADRVRFEADLAPIDRRAGRRDDRIRRQACAGRCGKPVDISFPERLYGRIERSV